MLSTLLALSPLLERRPLRRPWHWVQRIWLARSPMFSAEFYRREYRDVADSGMSPLVHFIRYGHKEGRSPHLVFNTRHYREQVTDPTERALNPLVHYMLAGARRRLSPSPWFDRDVYLECNQDVRRAGIEPFLHFCRHGLRENRKASQWFDPRKYLEQSPGFSDSGISALEHFLRSHAGASLDSDLLDVVWQRPVMPGSVEIDYLERLERLPPPQDAGSAVCVDVVVPVYRGVEETLSCLYHVLTAENETAFRLVVVDDGSPEKELSEALGRLAAKGLFDLHRHEESQGFCASINRGLVLNRDRDVIILNSDTEVYGDWIDRLRRAAYASERIATVTPMTNNGTIASYPRFCSDNPIPLELSYAALDRTFADVNAGVAVTVPTAVGFCAYIRRQALEEVGLFDVETFGRGYGEENDFCLRAQRLGWSDVIACDVFVRHLGGTSFRGERQERVERALKILDRKYPHYRPAVHEFIARDPLRQARAQVDTARLRRLRGDRNVVILSHTRGGGTEQNVQQQAGTLAATGASVFFLRAAGGSRSEIRLSHLAAQNFPNVGPFFLHDRSGALRQILTDLQVSEAHIHHLMDFTPDAAERFRTVFREIAIPYTFTVHDYAVICPRINLIGREQVYCGEPPPTACNACLRKNGSEHAVTSIGLWRREHRRLLEEAAEVIVPSEDVSKRLLRYFPGLAITVRPHDDSDPSPFRPRLSERRVLRVGIIGAISRIKGFDVIRQCAIHARQHRLPIQFVVVGYTMNDRQLTRYGVQVTGMYHHDSVDEFIRKQDLDFIWLPSVWPETYSYTLSIALRTGLPIMAFDIGAIAERLRPHERGILLPLSKWDDPDFLCREFLENRVRESVLSERGEEYT
nr:glycosyltransferase [Propylenella binzhouense]